MRGILIAGRLSELNTYVHSDNFSQGMCTHGCVSDDLELSIMVKLLENSDTPMCFRTKM